MEKQLIHKIFCRLVGRFSFAAVCVRTRRMRSRTSLARTHARAVARSCACAHVHFARASVQINSTRAWFAFIAGRLFSIRCACFLFFRDICQQRTSLPSRCFVFKLDERLEERGLLEGSYIWIFDSFLFFFFFFMIFQRLMFENGTFDTLYFRTRKDGNLDLNHVENVFLNMSIG